MKVLLLTTHMNRGGIAMYTLNLARYLRAYGVEAEVASGGGELVHELDELGLPHIGMDIRTKAEWGPKVWMALPVLIRLLRSGGYDLVHAQTRVTQVLARLAQIITGVPYVSTCHGFFKHRRLSRRLFPCWGDKVIAISDSVAEHLKNDFKVRPGRVRRVYNGIELDRYSSLLPGKDPELMREIGIPAGSLVIGSIGRLSPVKGYRYLVESFAGVSSRLQDARLYIVGDGPERVSLEESVSRLGIGDKVTLEAGGRPLEEYFSIMDVFCLPSVSEGLGLSLMEAMAAGRACVASDVGGISELVEDGVDGRLVPPGDPGALGDALVDLLGDPGARQRSGESARKKALANFSIEESAERTARVYREVAGKA